MTVQKPIPLAARLALLPFAVAFAFSARAQPAAPDIATLTATEAMRQLCAGTVTSEQLTAAYIAQAKAKANLNAFITLDEAGALKQARAADALRKRGGACKPLAGLPVAIKDNIQVQGLPATAGSPALKGFVPAADAPVVAKLRAAGAVILGKTNMHELAFGVTGYNPGFHSGPDVGVRNAYDATRIAGGSSSGNGTALGARMVPAALGTDTGGSVRIPCAFNGCASLRPTVGRYPQQGIAPISHTRDTAGPMAQSMADVALLDSVIAGGKPSRPADLKRVRLGVVPAFLANLDADTRAVTDAALAKLRAAGITLVDVEMPKLMELNGAVGFPLALYEANDDMVAYLSKYRTGIDIAQLTAGIASPDVKGTFEAFVIPRKLPAPNGVVDAKPVYDSAMRVARPALQKLYRDTFTKNRLDALVFPTVPRVALAAAPEASSPENFGALIQNTDPGSNAGIPGVQLPSGLGATTGLPVGLELDGPAGSDRRLLALGLAVEQVLGRLPAPR
ncbi:indoleacetamide hydrolase [Variovorax sp. NFACC27]|uniref:indoleacetamide hydrolase n=1 Tax=unclassified Variovorax TaxID=663243 RepID=UPI0008957891|nr:mandelamide amidase [Variovorax sp. NFACC28]SEG94137.1 mandelamide amidase [Variovorax sp. NFACC29]SFD57402.1 mandelamide amidase [Variovorax sp. NFACC26]SFH26261.1 mandelamide amidase [Variovorax sp. NFACC27]